MCGRGPGSRHQELYPKPGSDRHGPHGPAFGRAAALVLKPLEAAQRDNDRIYAVVNGTGCAGGAALAGETGDSVAVSRSAAVRASLDQALDQAGMDLKAIGAWCCNAQ